MNINKINDILHDISKKFTAQEIRALKETVFKRPERINQYKEIAKLIHQGQTTKYIMLLTGMSESYIMKLRALMKNISIDIKHISKEEIVEKYIITEHIFDEVINYCEVI